jgi:hypothetical protein
VLDLPSGIVRERSRPTTMRVSGIKWWKMLFKLYKIYYARLFTPTSFLFCIYRYVIVLDDGRVGDEAVDEEAVLFLDSGYHSFLELTLEQKWLFGLMRYVTAACVCYVVHISLLTSEIARYINSTQGTGKQSNAEFVCQGLSSDLQTCKVYVFTTESKKGPGEIIIDYAFQVSTVKYVAYLFHRLYSLGE